MKDEYKILIGAIVVILLVLVGAFALSGSGNPPAAVSPTVAPTNTPTPTAGPGGNGGTNGGTTSTTPSVTPVATPTATPVPTPTPEPESGVKLTEFGYWITYPPLGPQTWSEYKPGPSNYVYFKPTSASINPAGVREEGSIGGDVAATTVYRVGDLGGTVNVTIHMTSSANIREVEPASPVEIDYGCMVYGEGLTYLGDGDYLMVFDPGRTERDVRVDISPYERFGSLQAAPPEGWVKLTITGADGGYGVGADKDFTVNIHNIPAVTFEYPNYGDLWNAGDGLVGDEYGFGPIDQSGDIVYVTLPIHRYGSTSSALNVNLDWTLTGGDPLSDGAITIQPFAFDVGEADSFVTIGVSKAEIMDNDWNEILVSIEESDNYNRDEYEFTIDIGKA